MRDVTTTTFLLTCLLSVHATAQTESEVHAKLAAMCKEILCRHPTPVRLKLPGGKTFETTPDLPMPIISGDLVTVLPGETVYVEATAEDGRLVDLKAVATNAHPDQTLIFRFRQEPSIGDGTGMILSVTSPFDGTVKYRLGMMPVDSDSLYKTSSYPLRSGIESIEHWPHPLFQIVAADFRIVSPDSQEAAVCE